MVTSSNFVCDLGTEMTSQLAVKLQCLFSPVKQNVLPSFSGFSPRPQNQRINSEDSSLRLECSSLSSSSLNLLSWDGRSRRKRVVKVCGMVENLGRKMKGEESSDSEDDDEHDNSTERVGNDWYPVDEEERREWRRKIQEVIDQNPDIEEEVDLVEKRKKVQKLLVDYPLIVEEDDPDWPEDADGWGFNLGQFFNKITIKNVKKDDDDENYDSENEIVWQDDDYIRPIKDITAAEWEETVFEDISPLIVFVHNRYKRPKENEKVRDELEKAVHIIWSCRLPSPRCVAVDAVTEENLVSALQVSVFPELLFTKAGKILYREKAIRTADELSKIMAFFYYGAGKPTCLNGMENSQELIPNVAITVNDSKLS